MKKTSESLPTGQVLFILGIFLCSALIFFYLGARFGPELLRLDGERDYANASLLPDGKVEEEIQQILSRDKHEFIFHDALQDKKQLVDQEVIEKAQKEAQEVVKIQEALKEKDQKDIRDVKDDKKAVSQQQTVPAQTTPVVAQSPVEPLDEELQAMTNTVYHLQLGSFSEKKKAEAALDLWQKRGFSGSITSSQIKGKGLWYRLELGRYTTQQDVEAAQKVIQQKYGQSTRVMSSQSL